MGPKIILFQKKTKLYLSPVGSLQLFKQSLPDYRNGFSQSFANCEQHLQAQKAVHHAGLQTRKNDGDVGQAGVGAVSQYLAGNLVSCYERTIFTRSSAVQPGKVNMMSLSVLGLRMLFAKSVAANFLFTAKLFFFKVRTSCFLFLTPSKLGYTWKKEFRTDKKRWERKTHRDILRFNKGGLSRYLAL